MIIEVTFICSLALSSEINKLLIFLTGHGFASWSKASIKVRVLPWHENYEIGELPSLIFVFQKDGFQVLEETFLNSEIGKKLI